MNMILRCFGLSSMLVATAALAHHGWSEYDASKPLTLEGTIKESGYSHPHGTVRLQTTEKTWTVVLAPPSRMENRGLTKDMLKAGNRATVVATPIKTSLTSYAPNASPSTTRPPSCADAGRRPRRAKLDR